MTLTSRTRTLDAARRWRLAEDEIDLVPAQTAIILCDVWDHHWCPNAEVRLEKLLPTMRRLTTSLRKSGALIVHAPSETMDFYADHPARRRVLAAVDTGNAPRPAEIAVPALPVGIGSTQGCDTSGPTEPHAVWTRQHPEIPIDDEYDAISDDGAEIIQLFRQRGITTALIMGVHTNMCILDRSFAIKAMLGYGLRVLLVRDLTDSMYDPADPPYVDHAAGTALIVEYIEKFLCGTVTSDMLA
jgi:nicotinamidase-related amidase